jgi:SAM-dependent methyltransferase
MDYLDASLRKAVGSGSLGTAVEICSGAGEGFELFRGQIDRGIGVDISEQMLRAGQKKYAGQRVTFLQGDATRLPLVDAVVDNVIALGGIHHVNDREALFGEVARVLKPGGRFLFREPVSDMVLWRVLRAAIYRLSPALDYDTERPLTSEETKPVLQRAGLRLAHWRTYGSIGFCLFMNSDVLVFNRAFRHLPGIGRLTRWATLLDDMITRQPLLQHTGLQVIGIARKPD